jgi:membrane-associated protease RseP (regulator of RpoE activity)
MSTESETRPPPTDVVYVAEVWQEPPHPFPRWRLPLLLFLATAISTFFVGATRTLPSVENGTDSSFISFDPFDLRREAHWASLSNAEIWGLELRTALLGQWRDGLIYMSSLLAILLAHEFGHFIATRLYRVPATWPIFLPMPFSPFGTLGAVIMMDHRRADRKQIFDIGIAGPLAGLVVAVPLMMWGIRDLNLQAAAEGMSIDLPLLTQWFLGWLQPNFRPEEGITLNQAGPMFMAAWVGFVVTGLNMLPVSQLDGGHVTYALFGRAAAWIGWFFMLAVVFVITRWFSTYAMWSVMTVLVLMMGVAHPPTANDNAPLGPVRTVLGFVSLLIPVLTFAPRMLF